MSEPKTVSDVVTELFSDDKKEDNLPEVPQIKMSDSTSSGLTSISDMVLSGAYNTSSALGAIDNIIQDVNDSFFPPQYQEPDYIPGHVGDLLSEMTSNLFGDSQVINQISNYLSGSASAAISDAIRSTGLQQLQIDMKAIQNEFGTLKGLFTTNIDLSGGFTSSSMNLIERAEGIVNTLERLGAYSNDILGHIEALPDRIEGLTDKVTDIVDNLGNLPSTIEETFSRFQDQLNSLTDFDLSNTLDKLPSLVSDKFLDMDIIKDPLVLVSNVQTTVVSLAATIPSIKAPQNFNDVRSLLATLRSIVGQVNAIKAQADRMMESVKNLANTIQSGNYMSVISSLAAGGVSFVQRPPSYNAIYPNNHGYRTHGGHSFEKDNTPGSERLTYTHPTSTSVEVQPDGGVVVKGKSDFQLSISNNFDILIKNAANITVQGDARIIAKNVTVEAEGNATVTSGGSALVNAVDTASVVAQGSVAVTSGGTCTVSSVAATSISSSGPLTLSSDTAVNIISQGAITMTGQTQLDTITGSVTRTNTSETITSAGSHSINAGQCSVRAGIITLN